MKSAVLVAGVAAAILSSCQVVSHGQSTELPRAALKGMVLEDAIMNRRSIRTYSPDSLGLAELSQLLFAAQGITGQRGPVGLRSAPSAGATYPIEVYVFANRVRGLASGIYHYVPEDHAIELLRTGDYGDSLSYACLGQLMPRDAAVSLVLTAVPGRTTDAYGSRGIRYIHMEAGHVSQNICLQSTSLGLGTVPVGAFDDGYLNQLLGVDGKTETAIYVNPIGRIMGE
jgi:SagB-type dehydrogenase family enzyme